MFTRSLLYPQTQVGTFLICIKIKGKIFSKLNTLTKFQELLPRYCATALLFMPIIIMKKFNFIVFLLEKDILNTCTVLAFERYMVFVSATYFAHNNSSIKMNF